MNSNSKEPKMNTSNRKKLITWFFLPLVILIFAGFYLLLQTDVFTVNIKEETLIDKNNNDDFDKIENGIHVRTGFVDAPGLLETVQNCTSCHSSKLVLQNRMNKERWTATIKWMQETQNLWDLGENEAIIVNYLAINYPPIETGRRKNLDTIDWYILEE